MVGLTVFFSPGPIISALGIGMGVGMIGGILAAYGGDQTHTFFSGTYRPKSEQLTTEVSIEPVTEGSELNNWLVTAPLYESAPGLSI